MINFFRFLFSKSFLIQIGFLAIASMLFIVVVSLSLRYYTRHGEQLTTPNSLGSSVSEAKLIFDKAGLKCVVVDSIFSERSKLGAVIEQFPSAGSKVKRGREIALIINPTTPQRIPVPELVNISIRQAQVLLESSGFILGRLEYVYSDYKDLVVEQKINGLSVSSGYLAKKGEVVDLVVGKGPGNVLVQVPSLINVPLKYAEDSLLRLGLSIGNIMYDSIPSGDSTHLIVYKQYPKGISGNVLNQGKSVILWVTDSVEKAEQIYEADSLKSVLDSLQRVYEADTSNFEIDTYDPPMSIEITTLDSSGNVKE